MKSSTLRRSNISREKVAMLEALNRYQREHKHEDFYRIQNKSHELDALWQSFGVKQQKNEKAPQVYFVTGLVLGIIITLAITTLVSLLVNFSTPKYEAPTTAKKASQESVKFSFIPADNSANKVQEAIPVSKPEAYVVQEGDTLESIIIRFYGSFDMEKVRAIKEANKMKNPNALSIGQQLVIPMK